MAIKKIAANIFMGLLNKLKVVSGAVKHAAFDLNFPLFVMFCVTNRCPYKCKFCNIPDRKIKELSLKEIKKLIDQIRDAGTQILALWGGEPLLREDIGDIIDYAKRKGLMVILDSTGYGIDKKISAISKLDKLVISFDGPENICEKYKGKGSFKNIMTAFELSYKNKIDTASFTVLTKYNLVHIDYILDMARKFNFKATFKIPHLNHILGKNRSSHLADNDEYKKILKILIKKKRNGAPIANSIKCLRYLITWPDFEILYSSQKDKGPKCKAGKLFCNIDSDGTLYPCPGMVGISKGNNFLYNNFRNSFNGLDNKNCNSCSISFLVEQNFLLSLSIF